MVYEVKFPAKIMNNVKAINYFNNIFGLLNSQRYQKIVFDLGNTTYFETNLFAVFGYIIEICNKNSIKMKVRFNKKTEKDFNKEMAEKIFLNFSTDKRNAFRVRKVGTGYEAEVEKLLLKDLKDLNIFEFDKVKILLSELIANIKMHTKEGYGIFSGYYNYKKDDTLVFTIANHDITIADRIKQIRHMEFSDDYNAVLWALRKNNSTRLEDESGGLGLYLLRRYVNELDGKFIIISGNCYVEFDSMSFNIEDDNAIVVKRKEEMSSRYQGTIITIEVPYKRDMGMTKNVLVDWFDLTTLWEE